MKRMYLLVLLTVLVLAIGLFVASMWIPGQVVSAQPIGPSLAVEKADTRDPLPAGYSLHYTITITNDGDSLLPYVFVSDTIPVNTLYMGAVPTGTWTAAIRSVSWTLEGMAPNDVEVIHLYVHPYTSIPAGSVITNVVSAAGYAAQPFESPLAFAADEETTIIIDPPPTSTPTATSTFTSTPTATATQTYTPTATPTHTSTHTVTPTPTSTFTPTVTNTPTPVECRLPLLMLNR